MQELEKEDMIPFEKAIKNGADALLIGHLNLKKASSNLPATMSKKFITNWVRKKYKYNELVITDDMRMKAVKMLYGKNRPIIKAVNSGSDIILFKYLQNDKIINSIIRKVKKGKIKEKRINKSVQRILKAKERYKVNDDFVILDEKLVEDINNKIEEIRNKVYKKEG